jgi:hypothetical protein
MQRKQSFVQAKMKITNFVVATTIISQVAGGKSSEINNMIRKLRINCIVQNAHVKNRAKWVQSMTTALNARI